MGKLSDKGTVLYGVDPEGSPEVFSLSCIQNIQGLSGAAQQIDVTCFSSEAMEYEAGRANPGQITIDGIYDTDDESFDPILALRKSKRTIGWYIGGSDGTDPPTANSVGEVEPPTTRTGIDFRGYIADIPWNIQINNKWRYQIIIQRSGDWDLTKASP